MKTLLVLCVLALTGCASATWRRIDGAPINDQQLLADRTICRGEMQKADLAGSAAPGSINLRGFAAEQVYDGCMAQRGYLQSH